MQNYYEKGVCPRGGKEILQLRVVGLIIAQGQGLKNTTARPLKVSMSQGGGQYSKENHSATVERRS